MDSKNAVHNSTNKLEYKMSQQELIKAITEQLNGDKDVLAAGWEDSTTDELTELYNILVEDAA
jgi:hypothetical protein